MSKCEIIVEVGAEGGSITLYGVRGQQGWLYSRSVIDCTPLFIDEETIRHKSDATDSWDVALRLLDRYPWHTFVPLIIHPEFRQQIWVAVQKRFDSIGGSGEELEPWRKLCIQAPKKLDDSHEIQ